MIIDTDKLCDEFGTLYDTSELSTCPGCYGEAFCKDLHMKIYQHPRWLRGDDTGPQKLDCPFGELGDDVG